MKKLILTLVFVFAALFITSTSSAVIYIYDNDPVGWYNAVGGVYIMEDFDDATLNPGLSVVSDYGYIDTTNNWWFDYLYYDTIELEPTSFTTWTFATPIYAFGGFWDLGSYDDPPVGGPGSNIEVLINGSWVQVGVIDNDKINVTVHSNSG